MELDSDGNQLWNTTWGGSNTEEGRSLLVNNFNEIFVLANTRSFGMGSTDFALLKYYSIRELQWQRIWGGTDLDVGYKLVNDSHFNMFLIGYTESYGLTGKDACIVKYNSTNNYQWYRTGTDSSEDIAYNGYIDSYDNLHMTGKADDRFFLIKFTPKMKFQIIDGIIGSNGWELGGKSIKMDLIIAGEDPVAVDRVGSAVMGFGLDKVKYLKFGAEKHLGIANIDQIEIIGSPISDVYVKF